MAYNWFRTNFVDGQYVIFNSENNDNPFARHEQKRWIGNTKSVYQQQKNDLKNVLMDLAITEKAKETKYIKEKIEQLYANNSPLNANPNLKYKLIGLYENRPQGWLSSIINLLLQEKKDLEVFNKAINGVLKNQGVFDRSFGNFFSTYLKDYIRGDRAKAEFIPNIDLDLNTIIEKYLDNIFGEVSSVIGQNERDDFKKMIINQLSNYPALSGWLNNNMIISTEQLQNDLRTYASYKTKGGKSGKTLKTLIDKLIPRVVSGIGSEYQVTAQGAKKMSGSTRVGGAQGMGDVIILDRIETSVEANTSSGILKNLVSEATGAGSEKIENAIKDINNLVGTNGYLLLISNKDYKSERNFSLSEDANISATSKRLNRIANELRLHNLSINQLIFSLNNIVPNAFLESQKQDILKQIGWLVAAWSFDDLKDMFSTQTVDNQLHLYYINGMYLTLSDILSEASKKVDSITSEAIVSVSGKFYPSILKDYDTMLSTNNPSIILQPNGTQPRWDKIRESVINKSSLSVNLNRNQIQILMGKINQLIN